MKKSKIILSFVAMFSLILAIVGCSGSVSAAEAYVTIDINPSIELIVNEKDIVVYANALNEDAEILLLDLSLVGLNVDDAMDLIIGKAIELGYIDVDAEETYVSVSTTSDLAIGEQIKNRVMAAINLAFKNRVMMGKAQDKVFTEAFIEEAESYGVSPQFLCLAYSVTYVDDEITLESALTMDQQDLIDILKDAKEQAMNVLNTYKEEFILAREEIRNTYVPQIQAIEAQMETINAQIQASTDDTTALEAELAQLQTQLDELKVNLFQAMETLRLEYRAKTQEQVAIYQQLMEQRTSMFQSKVQSWIQNRDHRIKDIGDAIDQFQNSES